MAISSIDNATGLTILIQNTNDDIIQPAVVDDVRWEIQRMGSPSKLTFKVMADTNLVFEEGNIVALNYNGIDSFAGRVFRLSRDKDSVITVTAYDQIRYLKNKTVLFYLNKKASEVLEMIAADNNLKLGEVEDTGFVIPQRNECNTTMLDIIQTALDYTITNTKNMFILYDDFGKLCLKHKDNMILDVLIDSETAENYKYESSIDRKTFNQIKLYYDNKDTGKREIYVSPEKNTQPEELKDKALENIAKWGILQYCESLNDKQVVNAKNKANELLNRLNRKTRRLKIQSALGDIRVRGGSSIWVLLDLGDIKVQHKMLVESVLHRFRDGLHTMDLELRGGDLDE